MGPVSSHLHQVVAPLLDFKVCGNCRLPGVLWGQSRGVGQLISTYICFLLSESTVKPDTKVLRPVALLF